MPATERRWLATERGREIGFALVLLVPVVLVFAGAEWLVRQRETNRAGNVDWGDLQARVGTVMPDGMLRLRPNSRFARITINSHGYRGPALPLPVPPRTIRVAFLGDSKVLAADQPEAATLAAQTVARLRRAVPHCRFDYVSISGPGYTLPNLATLWREDSQTLRPSIAVLLAGASAELIGEPGATGTLSRAAAPQAGMAGLLAQSSLVRLVEREIRMVSPATPVSKAALIPLPVLAQRYHEHSAPLAQALGDTPVVAIAYRSQVGDPASPGAQLLAARRLRQSYPGLSVAKAVAISDLVVTELQKLAKTAGWHFIDPIAPIQYDRRNFSDRSHFSARGHARIANAVAAQIAPLAGAKCDILDR